MVAAIQSRLDILTQSKKLPKNLDKAALDSAVAGFDSIKAAWGEATAAATSGSFVEGDGQGGCRQGRRAEVMAALGMTTSG